MIKIFKVVILIFLFGILHSAIAEEAVASKTVKVDLKNNELTSTKSKTDSKSYSSFNSSMVEVGFEYPLNFGTHIKYYLSENFYSRFGVGFIAEFFLGSFVKLTPYLGYLNNNEASVISHVFERSFYADFSLGWFPYSQSSDGGPYIELGLSGMFMGHGQVSGFTLSKALNLENLDNTGYYSVKTNAYNGTFHVGYQIPFERLKLNIEVGLIKILHTQLKPAHLIGAPNQLNAAQTKKFQQFLKKKGWIFPTISAWIGFSF